jgi:hypothetical protein
MTSGIDLDLLSELHPEGDGVSREARAEARAALMGEIDARGRRPPMRPRSRLRLGTSVGFLAATVAVVLVVVVASGLRGGAPRHAPATLSVHHRAARAPEASGGPRVLRPGEYWYVHSRDTALGVQLSGGRQIADALGTIDRQIWIGRDAPSWLVTRVVGPIRFLSASARRRWERAGRPARSNNDQPNGSLPRYAFYVPYRQLLALPTNVDALWRLISRVGRDGSARQRHEMFTVIGDLLREDPVPPRVRVALYLVAARIPGIQLLGLTHDGIGRPALAVVLDDPTDHLRHELLFDPHTAKLLGESLVILKPWPGSHVKRGTLFYAATYLASGIVGRIGQTIPH